MRRKNYQMETIKVFIDSKFTKGNLEVAQAVIKGKKRKEILFSSYICHPSMANNELSGPVLLNALMLYIKKIIQKIISHIVLFYFQKLLDL